MLLHNFMIWRFQTIEGVLANIDSYNMFECRFNNGSIIKYDYVNEIVTIENHNDNFNYTETIKFRDLTTEKLSIMGFTERSHDRHLMSYITASSSIFEK